MHLSKRGRRVLAAATLPIVLVGSRSVQAANLYWDLNGTADGSSANTLAAGAWTAVSAWNSDSTGGAGGTLSSWSNANGDTAIFSAGTNATGAFTVSGNATAGGLVIEEGAVNLSGTITMGASPITVQSGATLVTNSSLRIAATAGSIYTLNGGTLRTTNGTTAGSFVDSDSSIVLNGGGTIDYSVANLLSIINPTTGISGTGPLTKAGVGVIGLAGAATHTGGTVINEGELRIRTSNNRLPTAGAVTVNSPGILNLNGLSQQIGSLSGTGNVGTGAGTLTIDGSASTTFDGAVKNIANAGAAGVTSGSGRIIKSGSGVITFNGLNDISGSVTLNAGGITVGSGGALAGAVADLVVNGGTLTLNNAAQTMENVSGSGGTIVLGTGHAFTTDPSAGATGPATTFAGSITGDGSFTKANVLAGATLKTQTLTGNNTFTGATIINGGGIVAASAAGQALGGTSAIQINGSTSTLQLGQSNQINNAAAMTLNGGTFDIDSMSETLGTLDAAAASTIDFGGGTGSVLRFADSSGVDWTGGILQILDWSGIADVGGGTEALFFGNSAAALTAQQLSLIQFVDGAAPGGFYPAAILATGEVVAAVPEPGSATLALLGTSFLALRRRRRA